MNTTAWLDLWGLKLGYSISEYSCMPYGRLTDQIDLWKAMHGMAEVRPARKKIPVHLR